MVGLERMSDGVKICVPCLLAEMRGSQASKNLEKPLLEFVCETALRPLDLINRKLTATCPQEVIHGCKLCGIHICNHIACWNEHIAAIPYR